MRVNRIPITGNLKKSQTQKSALSQDAVQAASFTANLKSSIKDQLRAKLNEMLKNIDSQGKRMLSSRTMNSVLDYKRMVKIFLNTAVSNIYQLQEDYKVGPKGKRDILVIVKNIDNALEDLIKMVLNKEVDNLKLLDKVGEIRGLLIDIYS